MEEQSTTQEQLNKYLPVLATAWYQAIVLADCNDDQTLQTHNQITQLAEQLVAVLGQQPFDDHKAQQIGAGLASLGCMPADVLSRSQAVLASQLMGDLPINVPPAVVAQLLGNLSVGYFLRLKAQSGVMRSMEPPPAAKLAPQVVSRLESLKKMQIFEMAIMNQRLRDELARQRAVEAELRQFNLDLAVVNRASQVFYSTLDLDQVLSTILDELHHILDVYAFSLWLIDTATNELVCYRSTDSHAGVMLGWRLAVGQGVAGRVAETGKTVIVNETRVDPHHFKKIDEQLGLEIRSILSVPLQGRREVLGVIQVVDTAPYRFSITQQLMLESLAEAAGVAIENARLFEQSRRDVETKSVLLQEINHRLKNNLAVIKSILHLKRSRISADDLAGVQAITEDVMSHVQGLATVHNLLSTSNWTPLPLSELVTRVIDTTLQVLAPNKLVAVDVSPSAVWVTADQAHDLALVLNELMTNAVKYALPAVKDVLKLTVAISRFNSTARLEFKDNGPGYAAELLSLHPEHHSLGFELIKHLVHNNLEGEILLRNDGGAVAVIDFPLQLEASH